MKMSKPRAAILALSFLSLVLSLAVRAPVPSAIAGAACLLLAVAVLYRNLPALTKLSADHPKLKTVRVVTVFNAVLVLLCAAAAVLMAAGLWRPSAHEEGYFAAAVLAAVILFTGNLAPKLPFSRHTGLRLPWTVADEETWIVAHRILGYLSLPMGLLLLAAVPLVERTEVLCVAAMLLWIGIPGALSLAFYCRKFSEKR